MIEQAIIAFAEILEQQEELHKEMSGKLSNVQNRVNEIYHNIEFSSKPDIYRGYLAYMELRSVLLERRQIKEDMAIVDFLRNFCKSNTAAVTALTKKAKGLRGE